MGLQSNIRDAVNWKVPVVGLHSSLREVIQQMVTHKVSALVVKNNNDVVGMVTDMDVLDCIAAQKDLDNALVSEFLTSCELITAQPVKSPCAQLDESESVQNAIKVLAAAGTHNLLVSGPSDDEVGIASIRDLLRLLIS